MKRAAVIYHNNCYDGFGAAWVVRRALSVRHNPNPPGMVTFHPLNWGDPFPAEIEEGTYVYIVDFAFSRAVLEEKSKVHPLVVIDHHRSVQKDLAGLPGAYFDMNRSGAGLAWDTLIGGTRPRLIDYIEDRDLWKFSLYKSREVHAWLSSHPRDFNTWDALMGDFEVPSEAAKFIAEGTAIRRFDAQKVGEFAKEATLEEWGGYRNIPTVNVPYSFGSETAHRLAELYPSAPFTIYYFDRADGKRQYGIRAGLAQSVDVSEIAAKFGGGGHKNAAGFLRGENEAWIKSR